jgi:hypothetical protein
VSRPDPLTDEQKAKLRDVAWQVYHGFLRRVPLSDGRAVLVDGDDPNTDEQIRAAVEDWPYGENAAGA